MLIWNGLILAILALGQALAQTSRYFNVERKLIPILPLIPVVLVALELTAILTRAVPSTYGLLSGQR
jgi:hypothetical protein